MIKLHLSGDPGTLIVNPDDILYTATYCQSKTEPRYDPKINTVVTVRESGKHTHYLVHESAEKIRELMRGARNDD